MTCAVTTFPASCRNKRTPPCSTQNPYLKVLCAGQRPRSHPQQPGGGLGDIFNDILKNSGANRGGTQGSGGSIGDILGEIGRSLSQPQGQAPTGTPPSGGGDAGKGLGDIFGELARKFGQPSQTSSPLPSPRQAAPGTGADQGANPDLGDIFAQLKDKLGQAGGSRDGRRKHCRRIRQNIHSGHARREAKERRALERRRAPAMRWVARRRNADADETLEQAQRPLCRTAPSLRVRLPAASADLCSARAQDAQ